MRGKQGLIPVVLATGIGVFNGYFVFKPAYEERKTQEEPLTGPNPQTAGSQADGPPSTEKPVTYVRQIHQWWMGKAPESKLQGTKKAE